MYHLFNNNRLKCLKNHFSLPADNLEVPSCVVKRTLEPALTGYDVREVL
jgi:hypothetical protein